MAVCTPLQSSITILQSTRAKLYQITVCERMVMTSVLCPVFSDWCSLIGVVWLFVLAILRCASFSHCSRFRINSALIYFSFYFYFYCVSVLCVSSP